MVSLKRRSLEHEKAKTETFLVSDDHDMCTTSLYALISRTGRYKSRLFKFSNSLLMAMFSAIGKSTIYERHSGSMQVDITHTKTSWVGLPHLLLKIA